MQHIELNEGLLEVGPLCFTGTPLTRITLPEQIPITDDEIGIGCPYTKYYVLPEMECIRKSDVED